MARNNFRQILTESTLLGVILLIILFHSMRADIAVAGSSESMPNQYGSMPSTTYPRVELQWTPAKPTAGQDVTFAITFINPGSSMPKSHVDYTFTISKDGKILYTVAKHTHSGTDSIKQKLASDGSHKITVTITDLDFKKVTPKSSDFTIIIEKPPVQEQPKQEIVPMPPPPIKEEQPVEAELDLRVQAKQIRDLVIIRVRSMDDSTIDIYGFKIAIGDSLPKASRGPKGWDKEDLSNAITFSTTKEPLQHSDKKFFILKIDVVKPVIEWEALGSDGDVIADGSLTPLIR
jgi:hypothetical protein